MNDKSAGVMEQRDHRIWWFAFGYFACYAPYSAITKGLTSGFFDGARGPWYWANDSG
jgi:hypothetical protein